MCINNHSRAIAPLEHLLNVRFMSTQPTLYSYIDRVVTADSEVSASTIVLLTRKGVSFSLNCLRIFNHPNVYSPLGARINRITICIEPNQRVGFRISSTRRVRSTLAGNEPTLISTEVHHSGSVYD